MGKIKKVMETENLVVFSPIYDGETLSEFEIFLEKFQDISEPDLKQDFDEIISKIQKMLSECGARENLFRLEGRNLKALPLIIQKRSHKIGTIRLYCIRISERILIIGNGGIKKVQKYQEDPFLKDIVTKLGQIEKQIYQRTRHMKSDYNDFNAVMKIIENLVI